MTKTTLALLAFVAGVISMFLMSLTVPKGQASTSAQISFGDARPSVPGLPGIRLNGIHIGGPSRLDGMNCEGCVFEDAALKYWGGPVRCTGCTFDGTITLELKGAALNGLVAVQWLKALSQQQIPAPSPAPPIHRATLTNVINADLISLSLGPSEK